MSKFNYCQSPFCVICKKPIGFGADHSVCSKKKQQMHRDSLKQPGKTQEAYPGFFIHGEIK